MAFVTRTAGAELSADALKRHCRSRIADFKIPREELAPGNDFYKKLKIDSLRALELITRLEHHFGVELPDYEVQGVTDFRTLASRIQARL